MEIHLIGYVVNKLVFNFLYQLAPFKVSYIRSMDVFIEHFKCQLGVGKASLIKEYSSQSSSNEKRDDAKTVSFYSYPYIARFIVSINFLVNSI